MFEDSLNFSLSVVSAVSYTQKFLECNYKNDLQSDYTEIIEDIHPELKVGVHNSESYYLFRLACLYGEELLEEYLGEEILSEFS